MLSYRIKSGCSARDHTDILTKSPTQLPGRVWPRIHHPGCHLSWQRNQNLLISQPWCHCSPGPVLPLPHFRKRKIRGQIKASHSIGWLGFDWPSVWGVSFLPGYPSANTTSHLSWGLLPWHNQSCSWRRSGQSIPCWNPVTLAQGPKRGRGRGREVPIIPSESHRGTGKPGPILALFGLWPIQLENS